MYRSGLRLLVIIIGLIAVATACQPEPELPLSITSKDRIGEISLSAPSGWSVYPEASEVEGRQGVTFVRFPNHETQDNIAPFPVVRINYDPRSITPVGNGSSLSDYFLLYLQTAFPNTSFEPPQALQVGVRPAVASKGLSQDAKTNYYVMLVEYSSENAIVSLALSSPEDTTDYHPDVAKIAQSINVKILATEVLMPTTTIDIPTLTPIPAEITPEIPPEITDEPPLFIQPTLQPENTSEVQPTEAVTIVPEATDEASAATIVPENTEEVASTSEVLIVTAVIATEVMATEEVAVTEEPSATEETTSNTQKGTLLLNGQITLEYPALWGTVTNNQNYVGLALGESIAGAIADNAVIPSGEAFISIEIGTAPELFSLAADTQVDLQAQLTIIAQNRSSGLAPAPSFGVMTTLDLGGKPGVGVQIKSANADHYLILTNLGARIYGKLELTTASGEGSTFEPILLEVAKSLSFPQQ